MDDFGVSSVERLLVLDFSLRSPHVNSRTEIEPRFSRIYTDHEELELVLVLVETVSKPVWGVLKSVAAARLRPSLAGPEAVGFKRKPMKMLRACQ